MSREDYDRICAELASTDSKDKPGEYDTLSPAEKELLLYWIGKAIKPASTYASGSSYGMKHDFEYQANLYVSNAQFKGAMLIAGYLPLDTHAQNWQFKITKTYDIRKIPHDTASQREYQRMPYYRTQLNGEKEPELQRHITAVKGRSIHFMNDSELLKKDDLLKEARQDRQQGDK